MSTTYLTASASLIEWPNLIDGRIMDGEVVPVPLYVLLTFNDLKARHAMTFWNTKFGAMSAILLESEIVGINLQMTQAMVPPTVHLVRNRVSETMV